MRKRCHEVEPISHRPRLGGTRFLVNEPLTADDWKTVHRAYQAFKFTIFQVVNDARERACGQHDRSGQ